MTLPSSLQAYQDCYDFFDRIMDDPQGGRVYRGSYEDAFNWRQRAHYFRTLDRKQSTLMYGPDDKRYGRSPFDVFRLTLKQDTEGGWWVYATRAKINEEDIQLLSELDDGMEEPNGQAAQ